MEGKSVKSGMSVYELDLCCCEKKVKEVESKEEKEEDINSGVFACTCCGSKLFDTASEYLYNEKYPRVPDVIEFTGVIARGSVTFVDENVYGIERVSFVCKKCGLNLGFIAIREEKDVVYCANPLCLRFVTEREIVEESMKEKENDREGEEVKKGVDVKDESVIDQSKDDKKEEIEKGKKKEGRNKKKGVGNKERRDEENQLSLPKVAVAFAGLLSIIGWAKFTNN